MYTKKIQYKKYLAQYKSWVTQEFKTTNDAIWLQHQALLLRNDVKDIVVKDII